MTDLSELNSDSGNQQCFETSQKLKLSVFPPTHFGTTVDEDMLVNKEDFPSLMPGDILEIHQPDAEADEDKLRLLLMVKLLSAANVLGEGCSSAFSITDDLWPLKKCLYLIYCDC